MKYAIRSFIPLVNVYKTEMPRNLFLLHSEE